MSVPILFDRRQVRRQRDRAAAGLSAHDFLLRESAERLADRLSDIRRVFPAALDLGCHDGAFATIAATRGGVRRWTLCDLSPAMVRRARSTGHATLVADEEALPFAPGSFDLVASNLSLHWVNDLPGTLAQIRRMLKPDGLFLAAMLGGETLRELRRAWLDAELIEEGGASPRVSPFADVRDLGGLLQRAGFALPVADLDTLTVSYADPLRLFADLRGMGEANAVAARRKTFLRRATLARVLEVCRRQSPDPAGCVPTTFQIVTMTAWNPAPDQPQPLKPGAGRVDLGSVL